MIALVIGVASKALAFEPLFDSRIDYQIGWGPSSVCTDDFNRDGNIDFAAANSFSDNISVLFGNGDGSFGPPAYYSADRRPSFIISSDFNGDGAPDLAASNFSSHYISVFINGGNGIFEDAANYDLGTYTRSIAAADFDNDGDIDIAVANFRLTILSNNGDGTFSISGTYDAGSGACAIFAADFNGDNYCDVVIGDGGSWKIYIFMNQGNGQFSQAVDIDVGEGPFAVCSHDFDMDGDNDLAVALFYGSVGVVILLNDGSGSFGSPIIYQAGEGPHALYCADIDNNGYIDLIVGNGGNGQIGTSTVSVLRNNGGVFDSVVNYWVGRCGAGGSPERFVSAADFDNDGMTDIICANKSSNNVSILINAGNGCYPSPRSYQVIDPYKVYGIDVNGDGHGDLVVLVDSYTQGSVRIFVNNGYGEFDDSETYMVGDSPREIAIGDFDGDEDNDLAVAARNFISILENNGDGSFQQAIDVPCDISAFSITALDIEGDSDCDLAVANYYYDGNFSLFENDGDGDFSMISNFQCGALPYSIRAGDFNNDGLEDVITANSGSDDVTIMFNSEGGIFQSPAVIMDNIKVFGVCYADFDNDSDEDVGACYTMSGYPERGGMSVAYNNGDGTFQPQINREGLPVSYSIYSDDFNGDNDMDLMIESLDAFDYSIFLNNGQGAFGDPICYGGAGSAVAAISDFDSDGDKDIAVTGYSCVMIVPNISDIYSPVSDISPIMSDGSWLKANFPNPFNGLTTIEYYLAMPGDVILEIFDILGRKIETLDEGAEPAGYHQATWDASGQASGVYFYTIKAGDYLMTKKMVLLK